jgi:hypothetical protein
VSEVLGSVAHGRHPLHGLNGEGLTLGQFIEESYVPWVKANRPRTAANTLEKLKRHFHSVERALPRGETRQIDRQSRSLGR